MASFRHFNVNNEEQVPSLSTGVDLELGKFIPNLQESLKINVIKLSDEEIVFDLIGVDASIANALRRILIAEVPTVAIETVFMLSNTSIIQDEVLAHRLGLIPLKIDPTKLEYKQDADTPGRIRYNFIKTKCKMSTSSRVIHSRSEANLQSQCVLE